MSYIIHLQNTFYIKSVPNLVLRCYHKHWKSLTKHMEILKFCGACLNMKMLSVIQPSESKLKLKSRNMYMKCRHAQKHILCVQYKEKRTDTAAVKNLLLRTLKNKHYSMYNTCA